MTELMDYVRHLPRDSALGREVLGEAAEYDAAMHRLTDIADLLAHNTYVTARLQGAKPKAPKPIKRPRPPAELTRG